PHGNYLLASLFFRAIAGGEPLAEDACDRKLALTGFDRWRIAKEVLGRLEHPPFTGQSDHVAQVAALERARDEAARESFEASDAIYRAAGTADPWIRYNHAILLDTRDVFLARRG